MLLVLGMQILLQKARVVSKARVILAVVNKSFVNLDEFTLPLLYKTLVRPHLEYGNVSWTKRQWSASREGLPKWCQLSRTSRTKAG